MTQVERLILENQKIILHALRLLVSKADLPMFQFMTVQDQMSRIDKAIREAPPDR